MAVRPLDRASLGWQIGFLVAFLGLVLVGAVAYGAGAAGARALAELAGERLLGVAANAAHQLDRNMFERRRDIEAITNLEQAVLAASGEQVAMRPLLEDLRKGFPHYAWLGLTDGSGCIVAATDGLFEGTSVADRPWFGMGLHGAVIGPLESTDLGRGSHMGMQEIRHFTLSAPVRVSPAHAVGVVGGFLSWVWAEELRQRALQLEDLVAGVELTVLDGDGQHLLGPHLDEADLAALLAWRRTSRRVSGYMERGSRHDGSLYGFATSEGYRAFAGLGWIVVARQPSAVAFAEVLRLEAMVGLLGLAGALVGCVASGLLAHRLTGPLRRLASEARSIAEGQGGTLSRTYASAELAELSLALRALLRRLGGAYRELRDIRETMVAASAERDLYRELASVDPLTGLLNRRALFDEAAAALVRVSASGRPLALVSFDIDHFKRVNDTHGHAAGDEVLRWVAERIRALARQDDLVARFGGEEFLVVLPGAPLERAEAYAENVRRAVAAGSVPCGGSAIRITVSAGCSALLAGETDLEPAIDRADSALYEAKAAGRNRVRTVVSPSVGVA